MKTKLTADQKYLRSIPRMSNLQLILLALSRPRPLPAEIFNEIQRRLLKNKAHKLSAYLLWFALLALPISAWSQDFTYSTNLFYALTYPTNIYVGTNGTDPGGDNFHTWATKINHNTTWLAGYVNGANTNYVQTSQQVAVYTTNYAYWAPSNYLGRFNGLSTWSINGGDDGGNPPFSLYTTLVGSYTGTNAWFVISTNGFPNGFSTTNFISLAVLTNGSAGDLNSYPSTGGYQVTPGAARIETVSNPSQIGNIINLYGQTLRPNAPIDGRDAATKAYVDNAIASLTAQYQTYATNGTVHAIYTVAGQSIYDSPISTTFVPVLWTALDGTGTNFLMAVLQTSLAAGFTVQTSTNLAQIYNWQTWTNWTTNAVTGTNTFTIPINPALSCQFFRILIVQSSAFTVFPTLTANSGTLYPSNTWPGIASITNGMPNFSTWFGSSNGVLCGVKLSNTVVYFKPIGP